MYILVVHGLFGDFEDPTSYRDLSDAQGAAWNLSEEYECPVSIHQERFITTIGDY